jgi:predicted O-linked N-acetylglucosamine transferase (SPINDLY family)
VSYLGYPATTGMQGMDYIIADPIVAPFADQPWYSEAIVHLPNSYFLGGRQPLCQAALSRQQEGLPDGAFVFCCFGQSWKIGAAMFDIWMRLLTSVRESVLWLRDPPPEVRLNLEREAEARGVPSHRLIWAKRVTRERHLARLSLADLVLDTLPYNGHATTGEALAAGVVVVSCAGQTFAGRVAASLLRGAGLSELVASTLSDYEKLALELARNPRLLAATQQKIMRSGRALLFDIQGYARNIEAAYRQMWAQAQSGAEPCSFSIGREEAIPAS